MAHTQVILLERIETLGNMGDVVRVRPGYARNYLLPQSKALRATKENIAYFEGRRKVLEAENEKRRKEAEKQAGKVDGLKIVIIRQASEAGQLYGSVATRDIAATVTEASGEKIERSMVNLNQGFKSIGLFPVKISLHPEVKVTVTVNIARSTEEAEIQARTGKALVADDGRAKAPAAPAASEDAVLEGMLEEGALKAEREGRAEEEAEEAEEMKARAEKSAARSARKKAKADEDVTDAAEEEEA